MPTPKEQAIMALEQSMLKSGTVPTIPTSSPDQDQIPEKTIIEKSGTDSKTYDNSNSYSVNLILPGKPDPNAPSRALTDEEKKKRMNYILGGLLLAIIIVIIALSMRGKK